MALPAPQPRFSREDFLAWEHQQPARHEYLAGEVFAMEGVSDRHKLIAGNLAALLRDYRPGERFALSGLALVLPVDGVYEEVEFGPPEQGAP